MVESLVVGPGERISMRRRLPDGTQTDLVGDLVGADQHSLTLRPAGRGPIEVPRSEILGARVVPARLVRPSSRLDDVQRLMARSWPGLGVAWLGGWNLHWGGGYSSRANSAHPTGSPEMHLDDAIEAVQRFYTDRGLAPRFQLAARDFGSDEPGARLDAELAARGWQVSKPSVALVRPAQVTDGERPTDLPDGVSIGWDEQPSAEWLAVEPDDHPARIPVLTASPAQYLSLLAEGRTIGCARLSIDQDWAGLSCLAVVADRRGAGLGRALLPTLAERAAQQGANHLWLQVLADNTVARSLYASAGFTEHHQYRYRVLSSRSASGSR